MKIKHKKLDTEWHKWFAWRPVWAFGENNELYTCWLCWVDRRWDNTPEDVLECHCWDYRIR